MDNTQKRQSGFCLENDTMFQIQDMFENGKLNIVLKTVKSFNIKRTPIIILIFKKSLKLGIFVLVMFNKILVIVFIMTFTLDLGRDPKNPVFQFVPISSVSFGTNVPCN